MANRLNSIKSKLILMLITIAALCFTASWGYYFFVLNLIHEREETYVQNSINQVVQNIQTSAEDMIRFAKIASTSSATQDFLVSDAPLSRLEYSRAVSNSIFSITQDNLNMAILIMEDDGVTLAPKPFLSITDEIKKNLLPESLSGFTGSMYNSYDNTTYFAYYQSILDIRKNAHQKRRIGSCVVLNTLSILQNCINQVETTPHSRFYILDADRNVIVSNQENADSPPSDLLQGLQTGVLTSETVHFVHNDLLVFYENVPATGWLVIGAVPLNEINSDLSGLLVLGMIVLVVLCILFSFWGVIIFRSIALPVVEISKFLQEDVHSKFHKRLHLKKQNEVGVLAEQINQMLDKISDLTRTILKNNSNMYELDLAKKRAELSALQSQINPHFLYNTLDCMKGYGFLLGSKEVVQIADSLSQIMRYSIKGSEIVTLDQEIRIIEQYLSIISIRFDNRFSFIIDIPESTRAIKLPRFILQPIVENAVYHGLEPKYGPGELRIYCRNEPGQLQICIQDNGVGIDHDQLSEIDRQLSLSNPQELFAVESRKGLAILNVHHRIQQFFGTDYGISVESEPNKGTHVHIYIPTVNGTMALDKK